MPPPRRPLLGEQSVGRRSCCSLRVDCERVAGSEPAPPSGRIRSCAAAPIGLDPGERFVAIALVSSEAVERTKALAGGGELSAHSGSLADAAAMRVPTP